VDEILHKGPKTASKVRFVCQTAKKAAVFFASIQIFTTFVSQNGQK
jgi:hypothetical protein